MNTIPVEELRTLKASLDRGEITVDEFQHKKRVLLGLERSHESSSNPAAVYSSNPVEDEETELQKMERELSESNAQILEEKKNSIIYRDAVRIGKYDYNKWIMQYCNNRFSFSKVILDREEQLLTPNHVAVTTEYKDLADRIMDDFDHYGVESYSVKQILYWHCTTIDLMSVMNCSMMVDLLTSSFLECDWSYTLSGNNQRLRKKYFGDTIHRKNEIKSWLSRCTGMQLCAIYCLCTTYGSINLAYTLAKVVEETNSAQWKQSFDEIYQLVGRKTFRISLAQSIVFENYAFYYSFHYRENGPNIR